MKVDFKFKRSLIVRLKHKKITRERFKLEWELLQKKEKNNE